MNTLNKWHRAGFSLLVCLLVVGCDASIDGWVVERSQDLCVNHNGVDYINLLNDKIMCMDGNVFSIEATHNRSPY